MTVGGADLANSLAVLIHTFHVGDYRVGWLFVVAVGKTGKLSAGSVTIHGPATLCRRPVSGGGGGSAGVFDGNIDREFRGGKERQKVREYKCASGMTSGLGV